MHSAIGMRPLIGRAGEVGRAPPGDRREDDVAPLGGHPRAVPAVAPVVESEDQPRLAVPAGALHDVEVVVGVQNPGVAAGEGFVGAAQGGDAVGGPLFALIVVDSSPSRRRRGTLRGSGCSYRRENFAEDLGIAVGEAGISPKVPSSQVS